MDLNTVLQKENISHDKYVQLFCIFGVNMKDVHDIPEMNFFQFLELSYKKLTEQFQLDDLNHPFYDYLNTLMNQYLETYFLIKSLGGALGIPQETLLNQSENKVFKAYISQELKKFAPGIYEIFSHSKITREQITNIVQKLEFQDITFDDVSNDFAQEFQAFVGNTYKMKDIPLNNESVENGCDFYYNGEYYHELLQLAQLGIKTFPKNPIYLYYTGAAQYFMDDNEEAKQQFIEFLIHSPGDVQTIGFLMIIELQELLKNIPGSQKGFEGIAKKVQEFNSQFPPEVNYNILYAGAVSNYNLRNFSEAASLFEKVLGIDPSDEANFSYLVASYERSGQFQKALDLLLPREEEYGDDEGFQEQLKRLQQKIKEEIL